MPKTGRLALVAVFAASILAFAVASASARRIETSNQQVRIVWPTTSKLRFTPNTANTTEPEVRCPVTVEGSFHSRTISKVCGQLIGYITRAALPSGLTGCELNNGVEEVRFNLETLPWHVSYASFSGTLPRISHLRRILRLIRLLVRVLGVSCSYLATEARPGFGEDIINETTGVVTGFRIDETREIPGVAENSFLCPTRIFSQGTGNVTAQGTTTAITLKLVA